jgi:lipopolysaccharide transport system permease protein
VTTATMGSAADAATLAPSSRGPRELPLVMDPASVDKPATPEGTLAPSFAGPMERRIEPIKSRLKIADLYRDLPVVRVLAARDFKVKYKQSILGPSWLVFQPLALLAAFLVAFRGLAGIETSGVPYVVFALVGLSVWAFFQASMTIGTASLVSSFALVKLTPCPRLAFPLAAIIASLPAMGVTTIAALATAASTGSISARVVLLPVGVLWVFLFTAALVAISSAITVVTRDVFNALPFLLQVGVFVTPVGYPPEELPSAARVLVDLNPLTGIIETWRWMVIAGEGVETLPLLAALGATGLLVVFGWRIFARLEVTMADDI